jgi:hypothetical protein
MRRLGGAVAVALVLAAPSASLAAAPTPPSPFASARLQGQFRLAGRVTVAAHVVGEHVGDPVLRTWTFVSPCTAGPCRTVGLARTRAAGIDGLVLQELAPAYYVGHGSFYAPLRCGKRIYPNGGYVPFTISVTITAATVVNGVVIATAVNATYLNRARINLTRCFAVLGRDAATYQGQLIVPAAPAPAPPPAPGPAPGPGLGRSGAVMSRIRDRPAQQRTPPVPRG